MVTFSQQDAAMNKRILTTANSKITGHNHAASHTREAVQPTRAINSTCLHTFLGPKTATVVPPATICDNLLQDVQHVAAIGLAGGGSLGHILLLPLSQRVANLAQEALEVLPLRIGRQEREGLKGLLCTLAALALEVFGFGSPAAPTELVVGLQLVLVGLGLAHLGNLAADIGTKNLQQALLARVTHHLVEGIHVEAVEEELALPGIELLVA